MPDGRCHGRRSRVLPTRSAASGSGKVVSHLHRVWRAFQSSTNWWGGGGGVGWGVCAIAAALRFSVQQRSGENRLHGFAIQLRPASQRRGMYAGCGAQGNQRTASVCSVTRVTRSSSMLNPAACRRSPRPVSAAGSVLALNAVIREARVPACNQQCGGGAAVARRAPV